MNITPNYLQKSFDLNINNRQFQTYPSFGMKKNLLKAIIPSAAPIAQVTAGTVLAMQNIITLLSTKINGTEKSNENPIVSPDIPKWISDMYYKVNKSKSGIITQDEIDKLDRAKEGIGTIYIFEAGMDLNSFVNKNRSVFSGYLHCNNEHLENESDCLPTETQPIHDKKSNVQKNAIPTDNKSDIRNLYQKAKEAEPEHHPDFYKLQNEGKEILASNYFRRGPCYGSPDDEYIDVINALKSIFQPGLFSYFKEHEKVKMLIGGIGESQEPFSLLATIKTLIGKEEICDLLDMYIVDLQGQPSKNTLYKQSFYDLWGTPEFSKESFRNDESIEIRPGIYRTYRVSDDIFNYLSDVYSNPEKAKWKTRIQDALKEYPEGELDIVSINNTLGYIKDAKQLRSSVKNIYRILKKGGIFISDNRLEIYEKIFTPENSIEIYPGIYQKK